MLLSLYALTDTGGAPPTPPSPALRARLTLGSQALGSTVVAGAELVNNGPQSTGLLDLDAFGVGLATIVSSSSGSADADATGVDVAHIFAHGVGVGDDDEFGQAVLAGLYVSLGQLDADVFGTASARIHTAGIGNVDADIGGSLVASLRTASASFLDPDATGVARSALHAGAIGINDADVFGIALASVGVRSAAIVDADAFGTGTGGILLSAAGAPSTSAAGAARGTIVAAASGTSDADVYGALVATLVIAGAGAGATNVAGVAAATILGLAIGTDNAQSTGSLAAGVSTFIAGLDDQALDEFGALVSELVTHAAAFVGGEIPGAASIIVTLPGTGVIDVDGYGVGLAICIGAAGGLLDADLFGVAIAAPSLRKAAARFATHRARLWRQLKVDGAKGNFSAQYDLIATDVPVELHIKRNAIAQAITGVSSAINYECFFDRWIDVRAGDRLEFPDLWLLLTNLRNQNGRYHEGQCDKIPGLATSE